MLLKGYKAILEKMENTIILSYIVKTVTIIYRILFFKALSKFHISLILFIL